jgi:hypothetical protein
MKQIANAMNCDELETLMLQYKLYYIGEGPKQSHYTSRLQYHSEETRSHPKIVRRDRFSGTFRRKA